MERLKAKLCEFITDIDSLYTQSCASYQKDLLAFRSLPLSSPLPVIRKADSWTNQNSMLSIYLHDFRSQCSIIGSTNVRLVLLVSTMAAPLDLTGRDFESIACELQEQLQTLYNIFMKCVESALSHALHDTVFRAARSLFGHVQDLLLAVESGAPKRSLEGAAGMVLQLSEDLQKMPITNKVAYRRCIMEKCITVKETIEEFQGYLAEREAHLNGEVTAAETQEEDDDDDDDEEDDNDERDYSAEEADSVRRCLLLMTCGQDLLKAALQAITAVGDGVLASDAGQFLIEETYCWIAQLTQAVHLIEVDCIDLGAELYPPVDIDIQLSATSSPIPIEDSSSELLTAYHRLHASQCKAAGLLQVASLQAHFNAELLTKAADIGRLLATL